MHLRVKDYLFDEQDEPLLDEETGKHKRNHLTVLYGRKTYFPGEILEVPEDVGQQMLTCYGGRQPIVEAPDLHGIREARRQKALNQTRDRDLHARAMQELDQLSAAAMTRNRLAHEAELKRLLEAGPGQVTKAAMEALAQRDADSERREQQARAEVPDAAQQRILALEAELERLRATQKPGKGDKG